MWGSWIRLRVFSIFCSLEGGWDYIGHDLAAVEINEDSVMKMSEYGTQAVTLMAAVDL